MHQPEPAGGDDRTRGVAVAPLSRQQPRWGRHLPRLPGQRDDRQPDPERDPGAGDGALRRGQRCCDRGCLRSLVRPPGAPRGHPDRLGDRQVDAPNPSPRLGQPNRQQPAHVAHPGSVRSDQGGQGEPRREAHFPAIRRGLPGSAQRGLLPAPGHGSCDVGRGRSRHRHDDRLRVLHGRLRHRESRDVRGGAGGRIRGFRGLELRCGRYRPRPGGRTFRPWPGSARHLDADAGSLHRAGTRLLPLGPGAGSHRPRRPRAVPPAHRERRLAGMSTSATTPMRRYSEASIFRRGPARLRPSSAAQARASRRS